MHILVTMKTSWVLIWAGICVLNLYAYALGGGFAPYNLFCAGFSFSALLYDAILG